MTAVRRVGFAVIVVLASWLSLGVARASERLVPPAHGALELGPLVAHAVDAEQRWSIRDAANPANAGRFGAEAVSRPSYGHTSAVHWYRIDLGASPDGEPYYLQVGFAELDHVTLYVPQGAGFREHATGDALPASSRDVSHPTFVFRLPEVRAGPSRVYLRVASQGSVQVPLRLWSASAFERHLVTSQVGFGFYYGLLLAMALYNLFIFAIVRERTYLYYVGYVVFWVLFMASYEGHATLYLWPSSPGWAQVAAGTFLCLSFASTTAFMRRAANLREFVPRFYTPYAVAIAAFVALVPLIWLDYDLGVRILGVLGLAVFLLGTLPVFLSWRRGYRPARFLVLWYALLLPGGLLLGVADLQWIPKSFVTEHGIKLGTALEAVLFSFALADRIKLIESQREAAQAALLNAERAALAAQRRFGQQLIESQDAERKRIASELHDGFGQTLLYMLGRLKKLASAEGADAKLGELSEVAAGAAQELRGVAHELHPGELDRLGLNAALEAVAGRLESAQSLKVELALDEMDERLDRHSELQLYRIAQEALSNVVRHAGASKVRVELKRGSNGVQLSISDDGRGLSPSNPSGLGLDSMRERARLMGASISLESAVGAGVVVRVELPLGA